MIPHQITPLIGRLLKSFPVLTFTGPRQSGKTTLIRNLLPDRPYVNLESSRERAFAQERPAEFLQRFPNGVIVDEAQHAPQLFSEIQLNVDERLHRNGLRPNADTMGVYVLTGSQNLSLVSTVSQSLAGRTAVVELLPLSIAELRAANLLPKQFAQCLVQGFFPAIHGRKLDAAEWLRSYLITYAERDARQISAIQDLNAFQRFFSLVATRTAQVLNLQSLGADAGVSDKTAKAWLGILETCYLIHYLQPHSNNFGKRLVKAPKLFVTDVGLACALMGIRTHEQAQHHPLRGALFETLVVNDMLKTRWNLGLAEKLYYWRDHIGTEVDVIIERGTSLAGVEIKSGPSTSSDSYRNLNLWEKYAHAAGGPSSIHKGVVYGGDERFTMHNTDTLPWRML